MSIQFILATALLIASSTCFAEGSAGVRGGGTGVSCDGKTVYTLEEESLKTKNAISLPIKRENIADWVKIRIGSEEELFKLWKNAWDQLGDYDHWETEREAYPILSLYKNPSQVTSIFKELNLENKDINFTAENDDYFKIPNDCKKTQISYLMSGKVVKINHGLEISEQSKRFIELHESFYKIGMAQYHHLFPKKTRDLIIGMNLNKTKTALLDFINTSNQDLYFQKFSGLYQLNGGRESKDDMPCPLIVIYLVESKDVFSKTIIHRKEITSEHPQAFVKTFFSSSDLMSITQSDGLFVTQGGSPYEESTIQDQFFWTNQDTANLIVNIDPIQTDPEKHPGFGPLCFYSQKKNTASSLQLAQIWNKIFLNWLFRN